MGAVWYRARAEMRGRLRTAVALSLLLALVGGAALAAAAGARRTHSAYPRFVERYRGSDVSVSTGGMEDTDEIFDRIEQLPMIASASRGELLNGEVILPSGRRVAFPDVFLLADADGSFARDAVKLLDGRLPDPGDPGEVMIAYGLAERVDLAPGDRFDVILSAGFGPGLKTETVRDLEVVGIYAAVSQFETVTGTGFPTVATFTPAFVRAHPDFVIPNEGQLGLILEHGEADLDAFRAAIDREQIPYDGITPASLFTPGVQRLNRIPEVALWILAGALLIAGLALVGQSLMREVRDDAEDVRIALPALGMSRAQISAVAAIRIGIVAAAGSLISIPVALLLSPATPIGLARIAEPDPGFAADWTVLGIGAPAIFGGIMIMLAIPLVALSRPPRWERAARARAAGVLSKLGAPVSSIAGVSMAVEPGRGSRAIPARSAMLSAALAVAALVAAIGFDRSFSRLQDDPALAGYVWDAAVITFEPEEYDGLIERIEREPYVEDAFRGTIFGAVAVDGATVSALAYEGYAASIVQGRAPRTDREVMLDGRTLRAMDLEVGERVRVGRPGSRNALTMEVVGRFIVPRLPFQASENPEQGAFLTFDGLTRVDAEQLYEAVYVRFNQSADADSVGSLRAEVSDVAFAVMSRSSAASVRNVERLSDLPLVIAGILGILGIAALAHAVISAIRRRRRDLAVLKTLGFQGRQIRATVAWQASTMMSIGLLAGIPAGIVLGRWGWRLFAEELDVVPAPVSSGLLIGILILGAVLLANMIAAFPARAAARTRPAIVLRAE
ncbi:MAG TPA: FtsX-like permease family protein [Actinomycetota bacterium]